LSWTGTDSAFGYDPVGAHLGDRQGHGRAGTVAEVEGLRDGIPDLLTQGGIDHLDIITLINRVIVRIGRRPAPLDLGPLVDPGPGRSGEQPEGEHEEDDPG
jgi:hypothetical protein